MGSTMSEILTRPVPAGFEFLRDASADDLCGASPPAGGHFVMVRDLNDEDTEHEWPALLWSDSKGEPILENGTDFFTVLRGAAPFPSWLPEGWDMDFYPTGLDLPNLEHWFRVVLAWANDNTFVIGPDFGVPSCPTVRGMVAHAHLIVKHLGLPDSPSEPESPLDRAGYVTHLRGVLDFLRRGENSIQLVGEMQRHHLPAPHRDVDRGRQEAQPGHLQADQIPFREDPSGERQALALRPGPSRRGTGQPLFWRLPPIRPQTV
jgi:hypothetical protein